MTEDTRITHMRADSADESSLQQIRKILFGEHRRLTAEQLARIESRLSEQDAVLRRLLQERIAGTVQGLQETLAREVDDDLQDGHDHLRQSLAARDETLDALREQSGLAAIRRQRKAGAVGHRRQD